MLMMGMPKEPFEIVLPIEGGQVSLTVRPPLPDIRKHLLVAVLAANMGLGREEELDLLIGGSEDGGEF